MSETETLEYLENELKAQIAGFDDSRRFYRNAQYHLTVATATISALTTVLIGAGRIVAADWWFLVPLVFSASITVASAYEAFLRPRELYIQKTDAWMMLRNLDASIKYAKAKSSGTPPQAVIDDFFKRLEQILMDEHHLWMTIRAARVQTAGTHPLASTASSPHKS
jgi:hypothetical protein